MRRYSGGHCPSRMRNRLTCSNSSKKTSPKCLLSRSCCCACCWCPSIRGLRPYLLKFCCCSWTTGTTCRCPSFADNFSCSWPLSFTPSSRLLATKGKVDAVKKVDRIAYLRVLFVKLFYILIVYHVVDAWLAGELNALVNLTVVQLPRPNRAVVLARIKVHAAQWNVGRSVLVDHLILVISFLRMQGKVLRGDVSTCCTQRKALVHLFLLYFFVELC